MSTSLTEKEFLLQIALTKFNNQFGRNLLVKEFDIMSIPPNSYSDRGYEIISIRLDDLLRMRMYLTFGTDFFASSYRLENTGDAELGGLGDEVQVTDVKVPKYYLDEGIYKFRTLTIDWSLLPVTLTEKQLPFISETGIYLIPEKEPVYEST